MGEAPHIKADIHMCDTRSDGLSVLGKEEYSICSAQYVGCNCDPPIHLLPHKVWKAAREKCMSANITLTSL